MVFSGDDADRSKTTIVGRGRLYYNAPDFDLTADVDPNLLCTVGWRLLNHCFQGDMGIYSMGPHRDAALELARLGGITTFVETGTYKGKTTRWASAHFDLVHTIEASLPFYQRYSKELEQLGNVITHFGDSRTTLSKVMHMVDDEPALFWLDGHWSGGVTAGEDGECPLIEELLAIRHRRGDVIMIDDARLFLAAPPLPFDAEQWPNMFDIAIALGEHLPAYAIEIFHDTIFMTPKQSAFENCMRVWSRKHAESLGRQATG